MSDLVERLRGIRGRVGQMCSERRGPRMSIPSSPDDDDLFIAGAADEAADEIAHLRAENDAFRARTGNSYEPCIYCGLSAEDQLKCQHGFPGCARADDQMLCRHFAAELDVLDRAVTAEGERDTATRALGEMRTALVEIKFKAGSHTVSAEQVKQGACDPGFAGIFAVADAALSKTEEK